MINLIEYENGLKFENVYVYSKSLYQPKYVYMETRFKTINGIQYFPFSAIENIMNLWEVQSNRIFIFEIFERGST